MSVKKVAEWTIKDVANWLEENGHSCFKDQFENKHFIDGKALLMLTEEDLRPEIMNVDSLGPVKRLYISLKQLQRDNITTLYELGRVDLFPSTSYYTHREQEVSLAKENCGKRV